MSAKYVYINDTFVEETQASILSTDLAIQRGYGIFDFFKTIAGKPVFLQDHLLRFYHSAKRMHLTITHTPAELTTIITELMAKNNLPDSGIRLTLTGGYSADGYQLPNAQNLIIHQNHFLMDLNLKPAGTRLVTYNYQRQLAEMKTIDYAMAIWLQPFIQENNADDVLYHQNGLVKEVPRANFFIVNDRQEVITAKNNVLAGVTRKNLLAMDGINYRIIERDFDLDELRQAKEAFISSTTKQLLPVLEIDGIAVGNGQAGEITTALFNLMTAKVKNEIKA